MTRKTLSAALLLAALTPLLLHAQEGRDQADDSRVGSRFANGIAAIAENKIITVEDIRREIQPILPELQQQAGGDPVKFRQLLQQAEDEIIQTLTDNVLIVKQFKKDGGQIPPSIIENEVQERIATQFDGDRAKFRAFLRDIGKTLGEYREMIHDEIVVGFMRSKRRKSATVVSPARIEEYYKENKERFFQEEALHLSIIRLAPVADEPPELLNQTAGEIIRKFEAGEDFSDLAREYSQDSKADKGGDWGWIDQKALVPRLSKAAFSIESGEISEPVMLGDSLFLLYVEDRRSEGHMPIEEVRNEIEQLLASRMAAENYERWVEQLRRDSYVRRFK